MPRTLRNDPRRLALWFSVVGVSLLSHACGAVAPRTPGWSTPDASTPTVVGATAAETTGAPTEATAVQPAAGSTAATPVSASAPDSAALPPPGPYLIHRAAGPSPATDLVVRHPDGAPAATWRLPDGGRVGRLADALSPDGRWLAFVTGDAPDWQLTAPMTTPLTLRIWDLSAGREAFATRLVRDGIYADLQAQSDAIVASNLRYRRPVDGPAELETPSPMDISMTREDVVDAFEAGLGKVAWSPDEQRLAFVAALDGPSGDVYAADVATWQVTRLSDEPTHVIHLTWSPDSRWVLHEGAEYLARAAGYVASDTTDSVDATGTERRHLWGGTGMGDGNDDGGWYDGWIGDDEVVLHREGNGCGVCQIIRVDVSTGLSETIAANMEGAGLAMEAGGRRLALGGTLDRAPGSAESESGVFQFDLAGAARRTLSDGHCRVGYWGAVDHPFARLPGGSLDACPAAALGGDGADVPLEVVGQRPSVAVSPHGTWRVLYGDEGWRLYDADSAPRGSGSGEEMQGVWWRPDDAGLFMASGARLWYVDAAGGTAREVGSAATDPWGHAMDAGWLMR